MGKAVSATGIYFSRKDKARIEGIAEELGVAPHALMKYAVMDYMARYERGEAKPKMEMQPVLIPPEAENGEPSGKNGPPYVIVKDGETPPEGVKAYHPDADPALWDDPEIKNETNKKQD